MQRMPYGSYVKRTSVQSLCMSAVFIAIGVILPMLFHTIAGVTAGMVFLPIHIAVFFAGLTIGPYYGAAVGLLLPIISALLTNMPPPIRLPFMMLELVTIGLVSGALRFKKLGIYPSLIIAQISGRLVYALSVWFASYLLSINLPPTMTVGTTIITGIPGIIIQLIFIPPLVMLLDRVIPGQQV